MSIQTEEAKRNVKNSIGRAVIVIISILVQVLWIVSVILKLSRYYYIFSVVLSLLSLLIAFRIYGEQMHTAYKLSWIILIMFLPLPGVILFLLFGSEGSTFFVRAKYGKTDQALTSLLSQDPDTWDRLKNKDREGLNQSYYLLHSARYPVYDDTSVTYYGDTSEALEAQKAALQSAKYFIFMEYHAIEDSDAWHELEVILAARAKSGVDVRVFYDDMGSIGFLNNHFVKKLESLGIRCRVFNPLLPVLNVFMNNRDHRKITVVDGRIGFTGGYNLADEYFNLTHPYGKWKDTGIRLEGGAVKNLTVIFLQMWNATQKEYENPAPFLPDTVPAPDACGFVLPYADSPLDHESVGENVYLNMIHAAKNYIYISTPYLIITDEMARALTLAARRGVDVRLVTPGIPDKKLIFRVTRSHYSMLAGYGVRIYEYTPGFIHAKQFVVDDLYAACGTINLDFRSLYLHFENGCWFSHCSAVTDMRKDFDDLFLQCREVTGDYKNRSLRLKGIDCLLRLASPLM